MRRRLILTGVLAFSLTVGVLVAWVFAGLPPARYLLRYGLAPACDPTGATKVVEGVEFVEIGPGISRMGSTADAEGGDWIWRLCDPLGLPWGAPPVPNDEMPVRWIEFRRPFWIARTEVTVAQFRRFDPDYRGYEQQAPGSIDDLPVVDVSWEEAKSYCRWLGERSGLPIRLPSEAEWECACRAGSGSEYSFGNDPADLDRFGWYEANTEYRARPVGTSEPNDWGLYDFHGNAWEWCEDAWLDSYERAPADGSPHLDPESDDRICRGGAWYVSPEKCRSARRMSWSRDGWLNGLGFRPAFREE